MWHALPIEKIFEMLHTSEKGLSSEDARKRLKIYGKNKIEIKRENFILKVIKNQITSPLVLLLISSAILSFYIGEIHEGVLIAFVIYLYIAFDIIQQYKSENILKKLREGFKTRVKVYRDNILKEIDSEELVPGDIVILKQGDVVPADIRIITAWNLYVDESNLTGESKPVFKENVILEEDIPIQDRRNMLFMGSYIVRGRCKGVVVSTGNNTVLGKMYKKVEKLKEKKTPLEIEMEKFGKLITIITIVIIIIVFVLSYILNIFNLYDAIIFSIALGVAVIPEGLPTVLTILYTISLYKIYKNGALVKRLDSVETLGSVDTIFTDKTGTLTLNQLTVKKFWFNGKTYEVTGKGYEPKGDILLDNKPVKLDEIFIFIEACLNSTDSELIYENGWKVVGDPLDGSLIVLAYKAGLKEKLEYINIFDFDRNRKRMSVIVKKGEKYIAFIKGAPEKILEISKFIYINNKINSIKNYKEVIEKIIENFAKSGYRLVAIGYKEIEKDDIYDLNKVESNIIFLGIVALEDPIREDVQDAIEFAKKAKIDIIVITGDHPETAKYVAKKLEINEEYILSNEIKKISDEKLYNILKKKKIVARADPEDKYRIIKVFKERNHIVAMTGDGINDTLALKLADIGISLSDSTDIAKEAADMILLKNSFRSIIEAIKEGRRILYDLKALLSIILSVNLALLYNILFSFFLLKEVVLKAVHILLINIAIEGINSIFAGTNDVSEEILYKKPETSIINKEFLKDLLINGFLLGLLSFLVIILIEKNAFLVILFLALSQYSLFLYYQIKYKISFFKNKYFYLAIFLTFFIIFVSSIEPFNKYTILTIPEKEKIIFTIVLALLSFLYFPIKARKSFKYEKVK